MGKEFLIVGFGQAFLALGSLVGVRLLTEVLPPALFGELSLAMTVFTLAQQLVIGPFAGALTRYYVIAQEKEELTSFLQFTFWLAKRIVVAELILGGGVSLVFTLTNQRPVSGLALSTTFFIILFGTNILLDALQTAARRRVVVALHQSASQWLRYLLATEAILLFGASSETAMWGYAASALLVLGSQLWFFSRSLPGQQTFIKLGRFSAPGKWLRMALAYASPSIFWGLFAWAQMTSDRWALDTFASTQDVGFYTALYQLGYYPMILLSSAVTQFVTPYLFKLAGDGTDLARWNSARRRVNWLVLCSLGATAILTAAAYWLHAPIFGILVAEKYRVVSHYLPWMLFASGLFVSGQMASLIVMTKLTPRQLILPKIVTALVGTSLNFIGAFLFGFSGVVFASILFSLLYFLWVVLLNRSDHLR